MTLQNGMKLGGKAILWADTAAYDKESGNLLGYISKAFQGLEWPFVGTVTTVGCTPAEIAEQVGNAYPSNLGELLAAATEASKSAVERGAFARILLAVADNGKPRLFIVSGCDIDGLGVPHEPLEVEAWTSSHYRDAPILDGFQKGWTRHRMKKAIAHQCDTPAHYMGLSKPGIYVGGNVVRYEVSAKGVSSAVERAV
ncbi:hypothetical protein GCM10023115_19250 [Pontixanthobacter gangjinensis]|uniref:Uncharacterized protein n=1 Tax=Pontixanthobacter gangjinensis TaxID=1028742 RepID=A0A6I4SN81_9SPHN|nr:hypothetical protein [Pontixanthobacter gangjinensis]MXO57174.1 hypothetical protein [Pontixanthobacter gangjinensis]